MSRTTQDIDGLVRGDIDRFLAELDKAFTEPWGPLTLVRGEVEAIEVPHRIVKPYRFDIAVQLNGVTWRRVQIEVSPDEGLAGATPEEIPAPSLAGFDRRTGCRRRSIDQLIQPPLVLRPTPRVRSMCSSPPVIAHDGVR